MSNDFAHLDKGEFEELKKVFFTQAYEMLDDIQDAILKMEAEPENEDNIKTIQRYVHTLKGDSNSLGLAAVGSLCHKVEDTLTLLRDDTRKIDSNAAGFLLRCIEGIGSLIRAGESGREGGDDLEEITEALDEFLKADVSHTITEAAAPAYTDYEMLQMENALAGGMKLYAIEFDFDPHCTEKGIAAFMVGQRLDGLGRIIRSQPGIESVEMESVESFSVLFGTAEGIEEIRKKTSIAGITGEIRISEFRHDPAHGGDRGERTSKRPLPQSESGLARYRSDTLRVEISKVDRIMDLVGELIIGRSIIEQIATDVSEGASCQDIAGRLLTANSFMERTISDLQNDAMKMRMVPVNHAFRRFPKMVRDLSLEKGKPVRLTISGRETELDKGLVDILGEPLSHIIRNIIDHGIEEPSLRKTIGKPEEGVVTLNAYHEAAQIVIEASDDGKGIDIGKLKKRAVERGFLSPSEVERLSDADAANLIFISGLSTSDTVSDTSGRGIGMDVVKSTVEELKGSVAVESSAGKGAKFTLRLPLTLAVIKAMLFEVGRSIYSVPIPAVAEVARISKMDLTTVDGYDTLMLRDQLISAVHFEDIFGIEADDSDKKFVLVLKIGGKKIGLVVDHLIGQQELVMKAVDGRYTQSGLVSGASILGNGRIVLILDVPALFTSAMGKERSRAVRT